MLHNWAAGLVPMTVMCWNNVRGVDLLCSLPRGTTLPASLHRVLRRGRQTFYMMAIEDRLDVAVPVCMVSEFRRILAIDSHHCMCNHVPGILTATDTPELAACFAPRPSLLICVTQDWTAWLPQEGFPDIRGVYESFGRPDDVRCTQYDWQHDYSKPMREEAYGWFSRYLMGVDDPAQAANRAHSGALETLTAPSMGLPRAASVPRPSLPTSSPDRAAPMRASRRTTSRAASMRSGPPSYP